MAKETRDNKPAKEEKPRWEPPKVKYVGNVGEIFLFPGSGKVSASESDPGDSPFKPKGQE